MDRFARLFTFLQESIFSTHPLIPWSSTLSRSFRRLNTKGKGPAKHKMGRMRYVDGVLMEVDENGAPLTKGAPVDQVPLAVVCTPEDMNSAGLPIPGPIREAVHLCGTEEYRREFGGNVGPDEIMARLEGLFAYYEVPIGLLEKVLLLQGHGICIILDDSGSMGQQTDITVKQAGPYMATQLAHLHPSTRLTRWQEMQDRLHILLDFLSCIPCELRIRFLNRTDQIALHKGVDSPEEWARKAHSAVAMACSASPSGQTPLYRVLKGCLEASRGRQTMFYVFSDGVPSDGAHQVAQLILHREAPHHHPITLISCTDNDEECQWMKDIEEEAPFTSEVDDYASEKREVLHDQGPVFPYTQGLWLLCMLVGALCPHDLDAMDDSTPFSCFTLGQIMGRVLTEPEYRRYFRAFPQAKQYQGMYELLLRERAHASSLVLAQPASFRQRLFSRFSSMGPI